MSDTTPNTGNRNDQTWDENPSNNGEVREPADNPEATEARATEQHSDEHHAANETDPNGFTGTGSHAAASEPEASPAYRADTGHDETLTHEPYRPAATVGTGVTTAAAATPAAAPVAPPAPEYTPRDEYPEYSPTKTKPAAQAATPTATQTATQQPIYVQAPTPPRNRGNRAAGILVALLSTVVYAALYAIVAMIIVGVNVSTAADATATFSEFIVLPVFYIPVIFFFLALSVLVALVNRGGWWAYVLFGFVVAAVVYLSYIGGALLTQQAWNYTPDEAARFVGTLWLNPLAIAAAVIAREVPIWAGAWIARRGRLVTERNAAAKTEYERQLAEGPQLTRSA